MTTRVSRFLLALGLLAAAWPALAHLAGAGLVAAASAGTAHPAATLTAAAALLLLGTVSGPVDRALTRLTTGQPRGRT